MNLRSPKEAFRSLRSMSGYDEKTKSYKEHHTETFCLNGVDRLKLHGVEMTNYDLKKIVEFITFPDLERLSLLENPLTEDCIASLFLLRSKCPKMTHLLVPPNIQSYLEQHTKACVVLKGLRQMFHAHGEEMVLKFDSTLTKQTITTRPLRPDETVVPFADLIDAARREAL